MVCCGSGDGTPQSCTSAIPEMDFAFGSKNPTDVSQLAALAVGVSITNNPFYHLRKLPFN
ncbi:hypothetical protein [Bacillus cereus]|uniref:Uncharacterized protein n=1 Tax=Bacillus cereus TaxID=1396 RepID=A0AAE9PH43_BACCE|nr:hypothetical protein [Bacillus cereus]UYW71951.1 hypothetical protein OK229_28320 [Bacillus cereus]